MIFLEIVNLKEISKISIGINKNITITEVIDAFKASIEKVVEIRINPKERIIVGEEPQIKGLGMIYYLA